MADYVRGDYDGKKKKRKDKKESESMGPMGKTFSREGF
jgi:hypothetical protein